MNSVQGSAAVKHSERLRIDLNPPARGVVAGALCGSIVLGGGGRLAMRLVALLADLPPAFTLAGTMGILLLSAVAGAVLGLLFVIVAQLLPYDRRTSAVLNGSILAALVTFAFLTDPGGELGLVAPWLAILLFAPLPLLYSLGLGLSLERIARSSGAAPPRTVHLLWLCAYAGLLAFALRSMSGLLAQSRTPYLLHRLWTAAGVEFPAIRDAQLILYVLLLMAFLGLHALLFWRTAAQPAYQVLSAGQLLLAGLVCAAVPYWQPAAGTANGILPELWLWGGSLLLAGAVLAGLLWRASRLQGAAQRQNLWLIGGWIAFAGGCLALWLLVLLVPGLQLRSWTALYTSVAVAPLILPWLAWPVALLGASGAAAPQHRVAPAVVEQRAY